jgi:hypothetical protein
MKVSVTYATTNYAQELDLIERLCKYEGYRFSVIFPEHIDFKTYYKGGHPAILVDILVENQPVVLYGFWQFVEFLLKNGMLRC